AIHSSRSTVCECCGSTANTITWQVAPMTSVAAAASRPSRVKLAAGLVAGSGTSRIEATALTRPSSHRAAGLSTSAHADVDEHAQVAASAAGGDGVAARPRVPPYPAGRGERPAGAHAGRDRPDPGERPARERAGE